ncbi:helix-turn-helix domain-containing protein [Flavobacterium sp.]|uniref:helix-turn-helix domain-containing protein n=1 Tax=Flavobacterium sp. TaxID=239 RepID=UPI00286D90C4|nr:helix-turn-helix domain-containing protein [Flavobacterium sp.]
MQNELDEIQLELTKRIHLLFLEKFNGNKLAFSKAAHCDEKTIRRLFENQQGMTINLLFKIAFALETNPSDLLYGLSITDTSLLK